MGEGIASPCHQSQWWYDKLSYQEFFMATVKIAVTLDRDIVARLDRLVEEKKFPNRSRAVQEAVSDKLERLKRSRLAREWQSSIRQPSRHWPRKAYPKIGKNGPNIERRCRLGRPRSGSRPRARRRQTGRCGQRRRVQCPFRHGRCYGHDQPTAARRFSVDAGAYEDQAA